MRNMTTTAIVVAALVLSVLVPNEPAHAFKEGIKKCCNVKVGQTVVCKKPFPCGGDPNSGSYDKAYCSTVKAVCTHTDKYEKKCPCPEQ
jgi:hypothetical protein